jgi:hypothetical protein
MKQIQTSFSAWELTREEQTHGAILTSVQKAILQNMISNCAERLLNLDYNPEKPMEFVQQQASLKGELAAYRNVLFVSDEAETATRNL